MTQQLTTQTQTVRTYIKQTRKTLTQSHHHLLQSAQDTKLEHQLNTPWQIFDEISFGYSSNEIGFGWTNGVILELLALKSEI